MFVILRKMVIKGENVEQVVNKFTSEALVEKQEGFIDLSVLGREIS